MARPAPALQRFVGSAGGLRAQAQEDGQSGQGESWASGAERGLTDRHPPYAPPLPSPATGGGVATEGRRGEAVSQSSPKVPARQADPCPLAGDEGAA